MRENKKSKYKLNIIISAIGILLCITGIILELVVLHEGIIFWSILLFCLVRSFLFPLSNHVFVSLIHANDARIFCQRNEHVAFLALRKRLFGLEFTIHIVHLYF